MLCWVTLTVCGAWLIQRQLQVPWMILCTVGFLAYYSPWSVLVLALVTALTGMVVITCRGRQEILIASLCLCVLVFLGYRVVSETWLERHNVTFLGLAFYMLRVIHLLLESYKGKVAILSWRELLAWLWFLPTLQVGPIHRFTPFQRDIARRRWDSELFATGLRRMVFGYAKLVIVGTYLVDNLMIEWVKTLPEESWAYQYFSLCRYGLSLYFQFAGYSDIAIGFALLLGFRVMENFDFPFLARDISDFWRRWHISLSSWCRDYVYMPAISATRSPFLAAVSSMVVLGIWHELSWRYLLWGAWHGVGIACCHFWQKSSLRETMVSSRLAACWSLFGWALTMHFVLASFAFTSVDSLADTWAIFRVLVGIG
ncbi:MBOAT family O-acyltransferase [Porticoccus sp.]